MRRWCRFWSSMSHRPENFSCFQQKSGEAENVWQDQNISDSFQNKIKKSSIVNLFCHKLPMVVKSLRKLYWRREMEIWKWRWMYPQCLPKCFLWVIVCLSLIRLAAVNKSTNLPCLPWHTWRSDLSLLHLYTSM